jgi:hypothetical protein
VADYIDRTVSRAYASLPELIERDRQAEATAMVAIESQSREERQRLERAIAEQDREKSSRKSTSQHQWRMK